MDIDIKFSELGGPTYCGRDNGEAARKHCGIALHEKDPETVFKVDIPASIYGMDSSFFVGLFCDSILKAGSKEEFFRRFNFETHGRTYHLIDKCVAFVLTANKALPAS